MIGVLLPYRDQAFLKVEHPDFLKGKSLPFEQELVTNNILTTAYVSFKQQEWQAQHQQFSVGISKHQL